MMSHNCSEESNEFWLVCPRSHFVKKEKKRPECRGTHKFESTEAAGAPMVHRLLFLVTFLALPFLLLLFEGLRRANSPRSSSPSFSSQVRGFFSNGSTHYLLSDGCACPSIAACCDCYDLLESEGGCKLCQTKEIVLVVPFPLPPQAVRSHRRGDGGLGRGPCLCHDRKRQARSHHTSSGHLRGDCC